MNEDVASFGLLFHSTCSSVEVPKRHRSKIMTRNGPVRRLEMVRWVVMWQTISSPLIGPFLIIILLPCLFGTTELLLSTTGY